ncbi:hypothetical protein MNBD_BACTEROID01-1818 [hydrothermal vent metagenome]|uniref:Methane oxygenase PmoA n=1 Tax=hydrothermal vent metagenome TaxID=652676 RepID=A0A3B0UHI7_9ZZZZ
MSLRNSFYLFTIILIASCNNPSGREALFTFQKNDAGVELLEDGNPVFFYQQAQKTLGGEYVCNNYIHPLYNLVGDTLTEESPADHLYHRGIFWAWHQIYINGQSIGDGWIMENISQEVAGLTTKIEGGSAILDVKVLWESPNFNDNSAFIEEHTTIRVHKRRPDIRLVDFKISLKALAPGVEIGGSDNPKGYGGFCTRIKLPADLKFVSEGGQVTPQKLQIKAGPWMDFSGSIGEKGSITGLSILCHPTTPNYPAPWILRSKTSMQNIVFPGQERVEVPTGEPLVLRYRLVIHNGSADDINISQLQEEYEKMKPD